MRACSTSSEGSQLELKHGLGRSAISGNLANPAAFFEHLCLSAHGPHLGSSNSGYFGRTGLFKAILTGPNPQNVFSASSLSTGTLGPGTVEKISPPPEDVARLFRALGGSKGKEISALVSVLVARPTMDCSGPVAGPASSSGERERERDRKYIKILTVVMHGCI